ncbi:MAG TPA: hypothetical protein VHX42_03495 [Candidatus Babeliales bacterium]|nr:hypothetical protein [Candidatus Babeliales bacterium]
MKKIVICMSLLCAVTMQASEKRSGKTTVNTLDETRAYIKNRPKNPNGMQTMDYVKQLDTKSKKISFEKSRDTQNFEQQK